MTDPGHDPLRLRFLARVIEHGFSVGLRTPQDLLRHFPPSVLMAALAYEPDRRARILQDTIGLRPRIALKKSPQSSGEDLQIALEEGETDAATIVRLFPPADLVRFLEPTRVWAYIIEPSNFGAETRNADVLERIREHTTFIIEQAREEGLLSARDILAGIGSSAVVDRLPREAIVAVFERALEDGRQALPFTDDTFFEIIPLATLVAHTPLVTLWDQVIGNAIAAPLHLDGNDEETVTTASAAARLPIEPVPVAPEPLTPASLPSSGPTPEPAPVDPVDLDDEFTAERDPIEDLLFDDAEAHPDADGNVTLMADAKNTEPHVVHDRTGRS
jgi:hypothetical protein